MTPELLSNLQALVALVLLGVSLPSLARAYAGAYRLMRPATGGPVGESERLVIAATGIAAIVRFFVAPKWIVTMYIGYLLTEQAIELQPASHYGLGSQALYHALFSVLPRDHRSLLWVNVVVGVLAVPLWAAAASRLLGERRAGAVFALLVALTPLFIKNDNSDANNVPVLFWLAGGLSLLLEYLERGAKDALAPGLALLALAAIARPEAPLLVPVITLCAICAVSGAGADLRGRLGAPIFVGGVLACALLVLPHALHVKGATDVLAARGSLPGWGPARLWGMAQVLFSPATNTLIDPTLYPATLLALAALGLAYGRAPRRARAALLVAATFSVALYALDLCRANMARVHVPAAMLLTLLATSGLLAAWDRLRAPALRVGLVLVVLAGAAPTAITLWQPTNEQAEEDFLREALAALPAGAPYTLVRIAREDRNRRSPGAEFTHFHFPDYLVRPPEGTGRVSSITDWLADPDAREPAYFYLGMRCYAEFRDPADPPRPPGENPQPACARLRERFELVPVVERAVPNRGNVWLDYYGDAKELKLGLYRIGPQLGRP